MKKSFVAMMTLGLLLSGMLLLMLMRPSTQTACAYVPPPSVPALGALTGLPSISLSLDGVDLRLCTSLFTSFGPAPGFTTPDPEDAIQVAAAVEMGREEVFKEFSITAIPFGMKPSTEALPRAEAQSEEVYRATLRDYREKQGGNPQIGPTANFFGKRVVGLVSVVNLHVDSVVAKPVAITEWVVEAGSRIWIIRASQELSSAEMSRSQVLSLVSPLGSTELSSPDLNRPSTSVAAASGLLPQANGTLDNRLASQSVTSDLPFPSWWDGDCDTNNYYAETGIPAYPLGAVYREMKACGPRPWADGAPEVWVAFFPGAVEQLEWQCPEISKRFMYLAYDIAPYSANGSQVVWNCDVDTNGCWLEQVANDTPGKAPQPDDILSYGSTSTWGHTSVVAESYVDSNGDGTILVIEQNSSPGGSNTLDVTNWVVGNTVSGWLHDPGSHAAFGAAPLAGQPPLTVVFTDTSTGFFTTQLWDFGDGSTSLTTGGSTSLTTGGSTSLTTGGVTGTAQPLTHTYALTGTFSVSLTVSSPGGSDTEVKTDYIRVSDKSIIANFTAHPVSGPAPLGVQFTDESAGDISVWLWDFGDGSTSLTTSGSTWLTTSGSTSLTTGGSTLLTTGGSTLLTTGVSTWLTTGGLTGTQPGPTHTYTTPGGVYTVSLTVSGSGITDTFTRPREIAVYESVYLPLLLHNCTSLPTPCVEGIVNGGFEDESAWVIPGTDYPAAYTTVITHGGGRSMRVGIVEPADDVYSYSSVRQAVTIPADTISATLRFWLYPMSAESPANPTFPTRPMAATIQEVVLSGNAQYVLVLDESDQRIGTLVWQRRDDQAWTFHQFDLDDYAGQTIKLQFGVYNDGRDGVTAMYVDDVSLEICFAAAALPSGR